MEVNKVVCMDNLEYMRTLPSESVDLVYSDILYGTGNKFKDYQDLKADKKVIEDFYIPRIKEMYRILKTTGSIYLQMDYRIVHWVRCIMDDIFGYENFRNEIINSYVTGGLSNKDFAKKHDNILRYSKSDVYTWNPQKEKSYQYRRYNFHGNVTEKDEKGWYFWVNMRDVWEMQLGRSSKERTGYATQKSLEMMERIIKASSNEGDVCADFFMGSGSFLVKAKELGRSYLGCDINPKAVEITYNRINGFIYE